MVNPGFFGSLKNVNFEKLTLAEEQIIRQREAASSGRLGNGHIAWLVVLRASSGVLP